MNIATQHTTRIDLDGSHHITVDWAVAGYDLQTGSWRVFARCSLWRSHRLHSGVSVAVQQIGAPVTLEVDGGSLEGVLTHVMQQAFALCMQCPEDA